MGGDGTTNVANWEEQAGIRTAKIDENTADTFAIIAAPGAGKAIHVFGGYIIAGGATSITEKDGATAISGAAALAANSGFLIPPVRLSANSAYNITSSAAEQISGRVSYKIV